MRDGAWREKGILEKFPADGLKTVWRVEAGGGWSSPVVADGRVFFADSELKKPKARERVRCMDAASGHVRWTYAYDVEYPDWAFHAEQNGGPTSTPAVADGKVYALGSGGEVMCLAAATGELLWHKELAKEYGVEQFRVRGSPLLDGENLILFTGGKPDACVLALDRHTGREVWKALNEEVSNSTPILLSAGSKRQLIVWTDDSVVSLDPASGTIFWREAMKTSNNDCNATPVGAGDRLLVSGLMFRLDPGKPAASIIWPESRAVPKRVLSNTSTPLLTADAIYSVTSRGDFVCLDAESGRELWRTDKVTAHKTGPSVHITPNGDSALLFTDEGNLIRARLTRASYEEISHTRLIEPTYLFGGHKLAWAPPAYANGHVFVSNMRELICVSLAAGRR